MARTLEETVLNAFTKAFTGDERDNVKPEKAYIAISSTIPKEGEHFYCRRLNKKSENEIIFEETMTSTVMEVQRKSNDVYVVITRNSYYIVKVLHKEPENIKFCVIRNKPEVGYHLKGYKIEYIGEKFALIKWETTTVQEVKFIAGLYRVHTRNTIYVCFPMN